jgi:hypothetical protein
MPSSIKFEAQHAAKPAPSMTLDPTAAQQDDEDRREIAG